MKKVFIMFLSLFTLSFFVSIDISAAVTGWKSNMEFSLLTANGNTKSENMALKGETSKTKDKFKIIFNTGVFYGKTSGTETANNWFFKGKEEFFMSEKFYLYDIFGVDSDKYAGYNYRYNGQGGAGYYLLKSGKNELKYEAGVDFTSEKRINVPGSDFISARLFLGFLHLFTDVTKFNVSADYLYDTKESENWRSKGEAFFSTKLKDNLSLKTGVSYKFSNLPVTGKTKTDVLSATTLIFDF